MRNLYFLTAAAFSNKCSRRRKIIIPLLLVLFSFTFSSAYTQPSDAWEFSRDINLMPATPTNNFQVRIELNGPNEHRHMHPMGNDLRFFSGETICNYWIEKFNIGGQSVIWVKVPAAGTTDLTLYYGNPTAPAESNGENTFDFFDGFDGSVLNNTKWTINSSEWAGGSITLAAGEVKLENKGGFTSMYAHYDTTNLPDSYLVELKHKASGYYRNRFYVTDTLRSGHRPTPAGIETGFWSTSPYGKDTGNIQWSWYTLNKVIAGKDYLMRWDISRSSGAYAWSNYVYDTHTKLEDPGYPTGPIHFPGVSIINISISDETYRSTFIDWVRIRKSGTVSAAPPGPEISRVPLPSISSVSGLSGCEGDTLRIRGVFKTNFDRVVKVGESMMEILSGTDSLILVKFGKVSGMLSVTTSTGKSLENFSIESNALPVLNAGDVLSAICSESTSAMLGGTVSGGTGIWSVSVPGGTLNGGEDFQKTTWTAPPGFSGSVTFTLTGTAGTCSTTVSKSMIVHAMPSGTVEVAGDKSYCVGEPVTFTAPAGNTKYEFIVFRNGTPSGVDNGTNPVFIATNLLPGDLVKVKVTNNGCSDTLETEAFVIHPIPSGIFMTSDISGNKSNDSTICRGEVINFSFSDSRFEQYAFIRNGTEVLQNTKSNILLNRKDFEEGDQMTVQVTGAGGCSAVFGPVVVKVKENPAGKLASNKTDNAICMGDVMTFTASSGFNSYEFFLNGETSLQGPGGSLSYVSGTDLTHGDEISVRVKNNSGCYAFIDTIQVTVNDLPVAPSVQNDNEITFCIGGGRNVSLSVNVTPDPSYRYQWYKNGVPYGALGTQHTLGPLTLLSDTGYYSVSFVNENGCHSPVSESVKVTIFAAAPKPAVTVLDKWEICYGEEIVLVSSEAASYQWYYGETTGALSPLEGQTARELTLNQISQTGYYAVGTFNVHGCAGTALSDPRKVTIHALPETPEIISLGNPEFCEGESDILSAPPSAAYQWFLNGEPVAGSSGTAQTYVAKNAGDYTLQVKNVAGCLSAISPVLRVKVNPLPQPAITGPGTICLGTSGNAYKTEAGMSNYLWNITGGIIESGVNDSLVVVSWNTSSGSKSLNVHYTDENGCRSDKQATFKNSPVVKPVITGETVVCADATVEYKTDFGEGQHDYVWEISEGGSIISGGEPVDSAVVILWTSSGNRFVKVNYTNKDNCNAAQPTELKITVNPLPSATISSDIAACEDGNQPQIKFTGLSGKAPYTFTYYVTNGSENGPEEVRTTTSGSAINVLHTTMVPGVYTYHLTKVSDSRSCGVNVTDISATVTINPRPDAAFAYTQKYYCRDGINPVPPAPVTSGGKWTASPTGLSIDLNTGEINLSNSLAKGYRITYTTIASGGCSPISYSDSVYITARPEITKFEYTKSAFCKSDNQLYIPVIEGNNIIKPGIYSFTPSGLDMDPATGAIDPSKSIAGDYTITYTISESAGCGAVSDDINITITNIPSAQILYPAEQVCNTEIQMPVTLTGEGAYTGGAFTVVPSGLSINSAGTVNPSQSNPGTYKITYTIPASGGCEAIPTIATLTVSPKPEVSAGVNWATCIGEGAINISQGADTSFVSNLLWTGGEGSWTGATTLGQAVYEPAENESGELLLTLTATGREGCAAITQTATKTLTINSLPSPVFIVPENAPALCVGGIQSFISVKDSVSDFTAGPLVSAVNALNIPDNTTAGVAKSIAVSGIPSNAIITSVEVKLNVTHTFNGDLTINLKAPNGKVLNIANALSGPGFNNTVISSAATNPIQTSGDIGPFPGVYAAQMRYGTQGATDVPGNRAFARSFDELFSNPNGNWILSVRDGGAGDIGTFDNWAITIKYSTPVDPVPVFWTQGGNIPGDLYLDAALAIPYTGDAQAVVYARPAEAGLHEYTASSIASTGCKSSRDISLNINPSPKVYIKADYCENAGDGKITLYAMGVENAVNYSWSTGETTSSVLVDIAHEYYVSVTNSEGCTGTGILSVAEELVVNGDFEQGNVGFYTEYVHMNSPVNPHPFPPDYSGLVNEGTYAVDTSAHIYHLQFHGRDHTTSEQSGKFLMVNGKSDLITSSKYPDPHIRIIWEQTVSVLPNTDYYFSAWAMNFSGRSATRLQFEVNGEKVGTIADFSVLQAPTSEDDININNWERFYNGMTNGIDDTWNSGDNTEAIIRIVNLNPSESGNDFGLDDISFGTLAPFVSGPDVAGRNDQTICVGEALQPIVYKVGSGDLPLVNLPAGFKREFDGLNFTISGGATVSPGEYEYILETTGNCPIPATATGKITVLSHPEISVHSATDATLCLNNNLPAPISFSVSGEVSNAVFTGLPSGITGVYNPITREASISGSAATPGIFHYTLKTEGICKADSVSGVIAVDTLPAAGTVTSSSVCLNGDGHVSVTGYSGEIIRWAVSDDNEHFTPISNTTDTEFFTNVTRTKYYKVEVANGVCPAVSSVPVTVSIQNLWEGSSGSDWNNPFNWASHNVPVVSTAVCGGVVTIPEVVGTNQDPVLTATAAVNHLNVLSGGHLTISEGGNLQIAGNITSSGIIDARRGGVEYTGNTARTIEPNVFLDNAIGNLKISTSHAGGVTLNAPIDIYQSLTFGTNGKILFTNDLLTFKSTREETAWLGNMTGKTINGKATVERFINTGSEAAGGHRKSWQMLATPVKGQSIRDAWQEGAMSNGDVPIQNPVPGYGTLLTTAHKDVPANGFDLYTSAGPSIKTYDPIINGYDKGPASTLQELYNPKGYMVLVRGDRTVFKSDAPAVPTILRSKGTLITGTTPVMKFQPNTWNSVGNPYPSAIDLNKLIRDTGEESIYAVWDPELSGSYGLGGITYLVKQTTGNYVAVPPSPNYPAGAPAYIQSGQAFWVQTAPDKGGALQFTENAKVTGSKLVMRTERGNSRSSQLSVNLYGLLANGSAFITDGVLLQFGDDLSNDLDGKDARKMSNTSENLSIRSRGKLLAIERRQPVKEGDTLFLNLSGMRVQKYRLEINAAGLQADQLQAYLEDEFLKTSTPLNMEGTSLIDFSVVNQGASYAANRFRIVFTPAAKPLPVTFIDLKADKQEEVILVNWNVENQINTSIYQVERSFDGVHFEKVAKINAGNRTHYTWTDKEASEGNYFYRIRSVDHNGKYSFSPIAKVWMQAKPSAITVYPNPISNGVMNVHLINQPAGKYGLKLINPAGQIILNKQIDHVHGSSTEKILWDYKMARGMYQVQIVLPDGGLKIIKVVY